MSVAISEKPLRKISPVLLGVGLLVHAAAAFAQADGASPPSSAAAPAAAGADAARLYDEGRRYFNVGEYDRAIEKLKAAYVVAPLPELLYDLGQAFRLKGDCAEALSLYRRYLKTEPAPARAERTRARIADMQECVGNAGPAPPSVAPPLPAPPAVLPSTPAPVAVAQADPTAPARPSPGISHRRWGWWTAAAAGALAAASGAFAWDARAAGNEVSSAFVPGGMWTDDDEAARRRGIFAERLAIGTGAAAALVAGAAVWLLWRREAP